MQKHKAEHGNTSNLRKHLVHEKTYLKLTSALYLMAWKPADNIFIDIFMWLISSLEEILFEISDNWLFHYLSWCYLALARTGCVWHSLQTLLLNTLKQCVGFF